MQNVNAFENFQKIMWHILTEIAQKYEIPENPNFQKIYISPSRSKDINQGEISTNAAMVFAQAKNLDPTEIAREITDTLWNRGQENTCLRKSSIHDPGFINFWLQEKAWQKTLALPLYFESDWGKDQLYENNENNENNKNNEKDIPIKVNIEFVSANPTGPLHMGHVRGAIYGDVLARMMEFYGYKVTKEYYVNDTGAQIEALQESVTQRYLQIKNAFEPIHLAYPGEYLYQIALAYINCEEDSKEEFDPKKLTKYTIRCIMDNIFQDLKNIGIEIDFITFQSNIEEEIPKVLESLKQKDLLYEGILEVPKSDRSNQENINIQPRNQVLFRSTNYPQYGDSTDRPVCKEDGSYSYFAPDIAYHQDKINRGFQILINIWGEDHSGYVPRMKAAVNALSDGNLDLEVQICKTTRLVKNNEVLSMSKRDNNFITLKEILEKVASKNILRFTLISKKNTTKLDFDPEKVTQENQEAQEDPVSYIRYAYERVVSVLEKARKETQDLEIFKDLDIYNLKDFEEIPFTEIELAQTRKIALWESVVRSATKFREPHRIAPYATEIAAGVHSIWEAGNENPDLRIIDLEDPKTTKTRLALARASAIILENACGILGIDLQEKT